MIASVFGDKVIRIVLILVLVLVVFWGAKAFRKIPASVINPLSKAGPWMVAVVLVLVLAASGKLNWLFAVLGVLIASLVRWMPVVLNHAPQLHRLWVLFGAEKARRRQEPGPRRGSKMSQDEAWEVLGLKPGASREDITLAHRKLIAKLHPDKGGSDYLAAQINLAKKVLLDH